MTRLFFSTPSGFSPCKVGVWRKRDKPLPSLIFNDWSQAHWILFSSQEMILFLTNAYHSHCQEHLDMDLPSPQISFQCFQDNQHLLSQGCPRGWHPHGEMRAGLKMFCWAFCNPKMMSQYLSGTMLSKDSHPSIHPPIHSFHWMPTMHGQGEENTKTKTWVVDPQGTLHTVWSNFLNTTIAITIQVATGEYKKSGPMSSQERENLGWEFEGKSTWKRDICPGIGRINPYIKS